MPKKFNRVKGFYFAPLQEMKLHKKRYYRIAGELYPSVTTVLSVQKNDRLDAWRDSVGHDVANYIARTAANRGKIFHSAIEAYLNNEDTTIYKNNVLVYALFLLIREKVELINNVCGLEIPLYSKKYKIAGRADCVADFNGIASVIDFKSATREKTDDIAEKHAIQETAYAIMFEEQTQIPIKQVVTLVACENGQTQVIIEKTENHIEKLEKCIEEFRAQEEQIEKGQIAK